MRKLVKNLDNHIQNMLRLDEGWVPSLPLLALGSVYVGQGSTIQFVGS